MAYTRDQATETHKDYSETINNWDTTFDLIMVAMTI